MISTHLGDNIYVTTPVWIGTDPTLWYEHQIKNTHDWAAELKNTDPPPECEWIEIQRCECGATRMRYKQNDAEN